MICLIENALIGSKTIDEFTDRKTGEVRPYYKIALLQDGSEPMEFSTDEKVFDRLNKLSTYDLKLEITTFSGKRRFKVIDAFQPGELDIA